MHPPGHTPFLRTQLPNGLTLLLHEDHTAPLVAVMVMVHAGSRNERPGKTGFAHLFEHLMFKGSAGVADGEHFRLLQQAGGTVNGTTNEDRTNYFEVVPSTLLSLPLELEADRFGTLLHALTQEKLDNQRDVVKNERRQSYDNQPYGRAQETISTSLFPSGHPYSWPVIGSMEDLSAATLDDVRQFFTRYYTPANCSLAIVGDLSPEHAVAEAERTFGPIVGPPPPAPPAIDDVALTRERRIFMRDAVSLPRLYLAWQGPKLNTRDEGVYDLLTNHLTSGRTSRLHRSLVYSAQIAQGVSAFTDGMEGAGMIQIIATAQEGEGLGRIEDAVVAELEGLAREGVSETEFAAARNRGEMDLMQVRVSALQKAGALATYQTLTGDAENANRTLARFDGITPEDLRQAAVHLLQTPRVTLGVVPQGNPGSAPAGAEEVR